MKPDVPRPSSPATHESPPNGHASAFTLVELLVVIAIIGMLVGLLLPAVQAAREAGRRTACMNSLKQVGLGFATHASARQKFPAGGVQCPTSDLYGHSWWILLLPYVEQADLYARLDKTGNASGTQFRSTGWIGGTDANEHNLFNRSILSGFFLGIGKCPSSPLARFRTDESGGIIFNSDYAGISGSSDHSSTVNYSSGYPGSVYDPGFVSLGGILIPKNAVSLRQIPDGTSKTMMVGEQSDYCFLADGTKADCRSACLAGFAMSIPSYFPNIEPRIFNLTTVRYPISKDASLANSGGNCGANSPIQSAHPGGAHALFADASVRFLNETTEPALLRLFADRDDGQPTPND